MASCSSRAVASGQQLQDGSSILSDYNIQEESTSRASDNVQVYSKDEFMRCRTRSPWRQPQSTTLHSPLKTSGHSTLLRKARELKRKDAQQKDKDVISDLQTKLASRPQYIIVEKIDEVPKVQVVEKIVERQVEKIVEVERIVVPSDMATQEQVQHSMKSLSDSLCQNFTAAIDKLKSEVDQLRVVNASLVTKLKSKVPSYFDAEIPNCFSEELDATQFDPDFLSIGVVPAGMQISPEGIGESGFADLHHNVVVAVLPVLRSSFGNLPLPPEHRFQVIAYLAMVACNVCWNKCSMAERRRTSTFDACVDLLKSFCIRSIPCILDAG